MSIPKSTRFGINSIIGIFTVFAVLGLFFAACKQLTLPGTSTDQKTFTVTFDSNGGSEVDSKSVPDGGKITLTQDTEKNGYIFRGWFLDNEIFEEAWDFENQTVTENIILYAQWTEIPLGIFFTVTFVITTDDSRTVDPQSVLKDEKARQPQDLVVRGFIFDGWYKEYECLNRWNFDEETVTDNITLYAQLISPPANYHPVSFDSNGGTYVPGQIIINSGHVEEPNTTKECYIVEGWYTDNETFVHRWNFAEDQVWADLTLYAKWLDADFGLSTINNIFNVSNATEWNDAVSAITRGGNNRNYIINIIDDFSITGRTTSTFGNVSGLKVSIRGEGRILYLLGNGNILRIGTNQTVILWHLTLQGRSGNNNNSLVYTSGTFTMNGGEISGNSYAISSAYSTSFGGGVYVANNGNFTMNGGSICGNTVSASSSSSWAYGGGVYVINGGNFTMNGGEIYGNTATAATAANSRGGGVYSSGRFRISAGTIYGLDEPADIKNTASAGVAFHKGSTGTAQYGTFNGTTWISGGDLNSPENNTIVISE